MGWVAPWQQCVRRQYCCVRCQDRQEGLEFQTLHHDLWDHDLAAPPVLGDITVNGRKIKAVMVVGKQAVLFTFDRVTGTPVWPIEERAVPQSTAPGEHSAPTQPFPTKPAPLDRQGVTPDDLIDFTPQLHQEALAILKKSRIRGPAYTPPSLYTYKKGVGGDREPLYCPGRMAAQTGTPAHSIRTPASTMLLR